MSKMYHVTKPLLMCRANILARGYSGSASSMQEVRGTADCVDKARTVHWKYIWKFSHGNLTLEVDCWLLTGNKLIFIHFCCVSVCVFCRHAKWV